MPAQQNNILPEAFSRMLSMKALPEEWGTRADAIGLRRMTLRPWRSSTLARSEGAAFQVCGLARHDVVFSTSIFHQILLW